MKISYFVHCFPPAKGGLEFLSGEIVSTLSETNEVHVFTGKGTTLDSYKTLSNWVNGKGDASYIHRCTLMTFKQKLFNKFLNKLIFKFPDFSPWYFGPILHYSHKDLETIKSSDLLIGAGMPTMAIVDSYRLAKKFNKPLILIPAYHNVSYYNNCSQFRNALNYANKVVFLSDQERNDIKKSYFITNSKFNRLVYSPYSENDVKRKISELQLTHPQKMPHHVTIGFVGQITLRKNLGILAELTRYLAKSRTHKFQILLAGIKTNSSNEVEKLFANSPIPVKFVYDFENKEVVYRDINIFVNPSVEESLGIVNFEAIFYGVPIIINTKSAFASILKFSNPDHFFETIEQLNNNINKIINSTNLSALNATQLNVLKANNLDLFRSSLNHITSI